MPIGIDAMGGDHAPEEIVKGALSVLEEIGDTLWLYGDERQLRPLVGDAPVVIVPCTQIVLGDDAPVEAVRNKKDSPLVRGMRDLKAGKISGFLSAGNTGALLAGGTLIAGRIKGVARPCITSVYPTRRGMSVLCDAGANADCTPIHLRDFALMSSFYAQEVIGIDNPRVGIVNIGEEQGKGNELVREAYPLMEEANIHFIGSVEGREIPHGAADVYVSDGFTGNVILKLTEGMASFILSEVKEAIMGTTLSKLGGLMIKGELKKVLSRMDYREYGGAPLLGLKGCVVKAHGSSDARAFSNALRYLKKYIDSSIVEKIAEELNSGQ
ncbi:MAG: phosphate acyltransferase PlsX [Tissierellia bacterium]|jgi:glycerol-3-phosphate acyltransferase PlsX|nr:phosphate acyltransferase PlsX [Bacillota bacterium]NLL23622.1 phosphate acyltransferase PlsX [Tissierellia bacterium]